MALGDSYATRDELKAYLKIQTASSDDMLTDALASASREIETHCNRQFNMAESVSARTFIPTDWYNAKVDDFATTDGLIIQTDPSATGNFSVTWSAQNYELLPSNQVVDGQTGWPYYKIRAVYGLFFPARLLGRRNQTVKVTAVWGWPAVPDPIKRSCLIMAAQMFKLADAPFGVAGADTFGTIRVRDLPMVCTKLAPYTRDRIMAR